MRIIIAFIFVFCITAASRADDLKIQAYGDFYIATDDNNDVGVSSYPNRYGIFQLKDNFNVNTKKGVFDYNLLQISFSKKTDDFRGILILHDGAMVDVGYQMDFIRFVQEANFGVQLFYNLWLDVGRFQTHLGGEAYAPKDNWLSSHSILTVVEPITHSGARLTYEFLDDFEVSLHIYNNGLRASEDNVFKSYGFYHAYNGEEFKIAYAWLFGNEGSGYIDENEFDDFSDPIYYSNFHTLSTELKLTEELEVKGQIDLYVAEVINKTHDKGLFGASIQSRLHINDKFKSTVRVSWWNASSLVFPQIPKGLGYTLGFEYLPTNNTYLRIEGRYLNDYGSIMNYTYDRLEAALNFGFKLDN